MVVGGPAGVRGWVVVGVVVAVGWAVVGGVGLVWGRGKRKDFAKFENIHIEKKNTSALQSSLNLFSHNNKVHAPRATGTTNPLSPRES